MDDIEKKLYHDLNLKSEIPDECEKVIRETLKQRKQHHSWLKILTTACASLLITAGVVYAGTKVIETIWEKPEKVVGQVLEENISTEEKQDLITEDEAKERTEELLRKFGYDNEKIESIELEKSAINYKINWNIKTTNNIVLKIDSKGGKGLSIFIDEILKKDIEGYHTTKQEAEKTARNLCKELEYDLSEYTHVEIDSNMEKEANAYIWYVNFYKEYDGLVDEYNKISIAFVPEINEIYYFIVSDENYENNSVEIDEEQAKEKALMEEKKTNLKYEIKSTSTELSIVSMNGEAYARTNNYKQFCEQRNTIEYPDNKYIEYRTNKHIRKAWKVTIEYSIPSSETTNKSFNIQDLGYTYYVDATTGEIIGGEDFSKTIIN